MTAETPLRRAAPGIAMAVAILAVSSSAPMVVIANGDGGVPALAVAFWRNALAVAVLVPVALLWRLPELRALTRAGLRRCTVSGVALAVHFATWVPSAVLTDVATATALVSTSPLWTGLFAVVRGHRLPRSTWIGIAAAVAGAVLATGAGFTVSPTAVLGDVLALIGGIAAAVYVTVGQRAREELSTVGYTAIVYSIASVGLLAVCLASGTDLWGYAAAGWVALVGLTLGPQMLGHSLVNFALHRIDATAVSLLLLLEVPAAAVLGHILLDQTPPAVAVPGIALIIAGVAVALLGDGLARRSHRRKDRSAAAA
ncbi:DMT family transporter [Phytomonospora sp. NPDC050363]|uniref:DMT family transporter n=1 Tax=Phytomonospora sp. NPDC050363 TaxID=3155642 RepID=UPI003407F672